MIGHIAPDVPLMLVHEPTQAVVASRVELALDRRARRAGLLGRSSLEAASALLIAPCVTIHTAFMRFPIDVLFLDREGRAVRIIHGLAPWRAAMAARARLVVELASGTLRRYGVHPGDRFRLDARRRAC